MNAPGHSPGRRYGGAALVGLALVTALGGCSQDLRYAPVEGTITLDGEPLAEVEVVFLPDYKRGGKGPNSSGLTDDKGHYTLITDKGQTGAVVGPCVVCIRDMRAPPLRNNMIDPQKKALAPPEAAPLKTVASRVPPAYVTTQQTPLRNVEVKPGPQTLDFDLGTTKKKK
jgi:hypothetical protein